MTIDAQMEAQGRLSPERRVAGCLGTTPNVGSPVPQLEPTVYCPTTRSARTIPLPSLCC